MFTWAPNSVCVCMCVCVWMQAKVISRLAKTVAAGCTNPAMNNLVISCKAKMNFLSSHLSRRSCPSQGSQSRPPRDRHSEWWRRRRGAVNWRRRWLGGKFITWDPVATAALNRVWMAWRTAARAELSRTEPSWAAKEWHSGANLVKEWKRSNGVLKWGKGLISLVNNKILIRKQIFNKSKVKVSIFRLVGLIDVSLVIINVDLFIRNRSFLIYC